MKRKTAWIACLIAMLLPICPMPAMSRASSTTELSECNLLLDEAETVIVVLLEENAELRTERETILIDCERIVRETVEAAVAEAAKPLLIERAGLKAEIAGLRATNRRLIGGCIAGALLSVLLGILAFR
ncbi:hypothetical protein ES703_52853 [subsurface metagenome]